MEESKKSEYLTIRFLDQSLVVSKNDVYVTEGASTEETIKEVMAMNYAGALYVFEKDPELRSYKSFSEISMEVAEKRVAKDIEELGPTAVRDVMRQAGECHNMADVWSFGKGDFDVPDYDDYDK